MKRQKASQAKGTQQPRPRQEEVGVRRGPRHGKALAGWEGPVGSRNLGRKGGCGLVQRR